LNTLAWTASKVVDADAACSVGGHFGDRGNRNHWVAAWPVLDREEPTELLLHALPDGPPQQTGEQGKCRH
jgi:hypothetical protein